MATPPSLADVLNNILTAISGVIGAIATAISENASVIGTVIILGALAVSVMAVGTKVFRGLSSWFRGLF